MIKGRVFYLDYLRGACALFIMIYHYLSWGIHEFEAQTFLGRIGKYGVSIFYILSGLTLFYVYRNKNFKDVKTIKNFFLKRFFRIFPLLYLIILIYISYQFVFSELTYTLKQIVFNFTGLFSVFYWDGSIGDGTWSIGNELSFYLLFPIAVISLNFKNKILFYLLFCSSFLFFIHTAYNILDVEKTLKLSEQWKNYINPLNQVFLFLSGICIGKIKLDNDKLKKYQNLFFLVSITLFVFYPTNFGDPIIIITESNRLIFSLLSILICFSLFRSGRLNGVIHKILLFFGEISYALYLIHPISWRLSKVVVNKLGFSDFISIQIILSSLITILVSYFVYEYYEKYFVRMGKKLLA